VYITFLQHGFARGHYRSQRLRYLTLVQARILVLDILDHQAPVGAVDDDETRVYGVSSSTHGEQLSILPSVRVSLPDPSYLEHVFRQFSITFSSEISYIYREEPGIAPNRRSVLRLRKEHSRRLFRSSLRRGRIGNLFASFIRMPARWNDPDPYVLFRLTLD
jgi:hypothetical protein